MYTATEWSTVADKEKFERQFKRFVLSGFKQTQFPKWFYNRLSNCFSHIAHYNQDGFFHVWFSTTEKQKAFLINAARHPCYGQPEYTFCDVEKVLQRWIKDSGLVEKYSVQVAFETELRERELLATLKSKYEGV